MALLKLFKNKARLAAQLSPAEWLALGEAWWLTLYFHLALVRVSYKSLLHPNNSNSMETNDFSEPDSLPVQFQRLVGYASKLHFIPMTCLDRSLALQNMLCKRSVPAQVRIGALKINNELYAHAWVEVNGFPIGEAADIAQKFSVLETTSRIKNRQFI